MPENTVLSADQQSQVNEILERAEALLQRRGLQAGDHAYLEVGRLTLKGARFADGAARLAVEWDDEVQVDVYWTAPGDPGRLLAFKPGPWRATLLGLRPLDS